MVPEALLSFALAEMASSEGGQKEGEKKLRASQREGEQVIRGQPPCTVGLPEPERHANFMVNWATHLDS